LTKTAPNSIIKTYGKNSIQQERSGLEQSNPCSLEKIKPFSDTTLFKYPQFDKLNQTMLGYFWRAEEVSLQKDRADFQGFRPEQKHIFTSNLKYQTLLTQYRAEDLVCHSCPIVPTPSWKAVL
jgi:ribonucleotide reductase beta subunit family protein with ferritin-like domain